MHHALISEPGCESTLVGQPLRATARGCWSAQAVLSTARVASTACVGTARCALGIAASVFAATFIPGCGSPARAQAPAEAPIASTIDEVWKKSQSLRPQLSTDTTPVTVKVGSVTYKIPRNYISMVFDFPQLKVTYPGFKPFTEETRGCFDRRLEAELGCTTLELNMRLSFPNRPRFENAIKASPPFREKPLSSRPGPYGYDIYDQGPDNARREIYRSESEDIFFTCGIFDNNGVRDAICDDAVSLSDGNAVRFFFRLNQISEVRNFEAGIRQLMAGFVQGDEK
jgi:hypothetical protein